MKYTRGQFTKEYYQLWEMGLLLPTPTSASIYSVKYRKNQFDEYSRITLKAVSATDALERACYAITYASPWRPEDIDLHAVYDEEENLLWIDEPYYDLVQKKNEFRGMERREFLVRFGVTSAAILFGLKPFVAKAGVTTTALSGVASGFPAPPGEQLYTTAGSYNWTVPSGVNSVHIVCVGGGAGNGGGGGGLTWKNSISVSSGQSHVIIAGGGGTGGLSAGVGGGTGGTSSAFGVSASGGKSSADSSATNGGIGGASLGGDGGGNGGYAYPSGYHGGGAGGYSGVGGAVYSSGTATNPTGGGGGAGTWAYCSGGGVGLYGQGANGISGQGSANGAGGTGGSGGGNGAPYSPGGNYGGGGCGYNGSSAGLPGGSGAVRIIWGAGRSFPSNAS